MTNLLKCNECGMLFAEEDLIEEEEYRDDAYGSPAYEKMTYSPCCHSDYSEYSEDSSQMWKCKGCGKIFYGDDLDIDYEKVSSIEYEIVRACPECMDEVEKYDEE